MYWQRRLVAAAVLGLVMAFASGCGGESKMKVSGKVLMKGQPLNLTKKTYFTLTFAPVSDKVFQTTPAKFSRETGQYEIELVPGKYRVTSVLMDMENNQAIPTAAAKDYDLSKTQVLDIDLAPQ